MREPPLDLDQTPPFDPADPEPVPEIDFEPERLLRAASQDGATSVGFAAARGAKLQPARARSGTRS